MVGVVVIRQAKAEDIIGISQLAYDVLPERYSSSVFSSLFERFPEGMLVAEDGVQIIGFLIGIIPGETSARILMLGVQPGFQKKGVGTGLLTAFVAGMESYHVSSVHLEVLTTNEAAISFYTKNGFSIEERIKRFYVTGQDAFLMRKTLSSLSARVPSPS